MLCVQLKAQQREYLKGRLLYRNSNVVAANVINTTAQLNTITNGNGEFEILAALNDEIIFLRCNTVLERWKLHQTS